MSTTAKFSNALAEDDAADLVADAARIGTWLQEFSRHVRQMRDRAPVLAAVAAPQPILDELRLREEELLAAEEELSRQIEELGRTRILVERERARYFDLFDAAPDAYIVTDLAGIIREANGAAGALLNVRSDFLAGKPLLNFVARQDTRTFRAAVQGLPRIDHIEKLEVRMRARHGKSTFRASFRISAVTEQRRIVALRWTVRDKSAFDEAAESVASTARALREGAIEPAVAADQLEAAAAAFRRPDPTTT